MKECYVCRNDVPELFEDYRINRGEIESELEICLICGTLQGKESFVKKLRIEGKVSLYKRKLEEGENV